MSVSLNKIDGEMLKSQKNIEDAFSNLQSTQLAEGAIGDEDSTDLEDRTPALSERELILPVLNKTFKIENTFEYESDAFINNTQLRYNPWSRTILGKTYQESRVRKRDRKQPDHNKSEEFLNWEKTGQVRGGLYGVGLFLFFVYIL